MNAKEFLISIVPSMENEDILSFHSFSGEFLLFIMDKYAEYKVKNCNTPAVSEIVEPVRDGTVCPKCGIEYWYNYKYGEYESQCDCKKGQTGR